MLPSGDALTIRLNEATADALQRLDPWAPDHSWLQIYTDASANGAVHGSAWFRMGPMCAW